MVNPRNIAQALLCVEFLSQGNALFDVFLTVAQVHIPIEPCEEIRGDNKIALLPSGKKLIVPVFRKHAAAMKKVFSELSSDELLQLESILKKAGRHAEALDIRI